MHFLYFFVFLDVMVLNDIINQAASRSSFESNKRRKSRKISNFLHSEEEDEGIRLKEKLTVLVYKFINIFCVWDCCHAYIRISEVVKLFCDL